MNFDDKKILIRFITRPGMFITSLDKDNIISFISGYEIGSPTCNFTEPLELYISQTFGFQFNSSRWVGQVELLSRKLALTWVVTFKKTALGLIVDSDADGILSEINTTLRTRIISLTKRIVETGDPFFNKSWVDEWLSLCLTKSDWFTRMWTKDEEKLIRAIDNKVRRKKVFSDDNSLLPTTDLLRLKQRFDLLAETNGT